MNGERLSAAKIVALSTGVAIGGIACAGDAVPVMYSATELEHEIIIDVPDVPGGSRLEILTKQGSYRLSYCDGIELIDHTTRVDEDGNITEEEQFRSIHTACADGIVGRDELQDN